MLRLLRNVHFCVGNSSNAMQRHFFLRKYLNRIVLCQSVTCCVGEGMSLQEDGMSGREEIFDDDCPATRYCLHHVPGSKRHALIVVM